MSDGSCKKCGTRYNVPTSGVCYPCASSGLIYRCYYDERGNFQQQLVGKVSK